MCRLTLFLLTTAAALMGFAQPSAGAGELRYSTVTGAGGVPLQVVTAGDVANPAIILVHGLGQSHFMFHEQLESDLADDHYLVSFDLRGHGASGKPWETAAYNTTEVWAEDVAAVIAATGATHPLLVGWSFGSLVALDYLRAYGPEQVSGLVLTGAIGALLPARLPGKDDPLTEEFIRVRQLQLSKDPRDQLKALSRMVRWLTASEAAEEDRRVLEATAMMFPAYARRAIYTRRADNRDLLLAVETLPTLFALGSEDNALMLEDAARLAIEVPSIRLSVYEGAGHSVFFENPLRFNSELRALAARAFLDDERDAAGAANATAVTSSR